MGRGGILVGKESTYEVTLRNAGEVAAENVVVSVELPEWADVTGAEATAGSTDAGKLPRTPGPLQWRVGRLEPKDKPKLVVRVVPRQSRPFELGVKWDYTPAGSQAQIEVQEPKLAIGFQGPREVLWGKAEIFKLEVTNTGTGDAENVVVTIAPVAVGPQPAADRARSRPRTSSARWPPVRRRPSTSNSTPGRREISPSTSTPAATAASTPSATSRSWSAGPC